MVENYKIYEKNEKQKEIKWALEGFSKESKEIRLSLEDTRIAKSKLARFMSTNTEASHDSNVDLSGYHFDTVNRWPNMKPHPEMVVEEVNSLDNRFQEIIDGYLKSNPAKIKELQVKLNDWINYWMVIDDKSSPSGKRTIHPIDVEVLKRILQWTGMELTDNWSDSKRRYTIREDGMLWPQTFAVLCCFKKEFRKSATRNTNRGTRQR